MSTNKRKQYNQKDMDVAVQAVLLSEMSTRKAAALYNVPKTTLIDKVKGRYAVTPSPKTILTPEEERKLVEWLHLTSSRGCGKTKEDLCLAVQRILNAEDRKTPFTNNKPGPSWYRGFLQRHPNIRLRKAMVLGEQRAHVTEGKIRAWFSGAQDSLLKDGIDISQMPPSNIFNCDETGFPFFMQGSSVLADVRNKHPYELGSDTKQQITVLGCCSAEGKVLPPTIIFPGMRWTFHPWDDFGDAHFTHTPNGWINAEVFLQWLQHTFAPAVQHLKRPVVLFADGHQSHVSMEVHSFCREHSITYYVLPAHASHIVQPLDLVFYGSLKEEWKRAVREFKAIARISSVTKATFTRVFRDAWLQAYQKDKVVNAFTASGLFPWNPDRPDYSKCQASQVYGKSVREKNTIPPVSTSTDITTLSSPAQQPAGNIPDCPPPTLQDHEIPSTSTDLTTCSLPSPLPAGTGMDIFDRPPTLVDNKPPVPSTSTSTDIGMFSLSPPSPLPAEIDVSKNCHPTPVDNEPPVPSTSTSTDIGMFSLSPPSPLPAEIDVSKNCHPTPVDNEPPVPSTSTDMTICPPPEQQPTAMTPDCPPPTLMDHELPSIPPAAQAPLPLGDDVDIGFKVNMLIDHVISCGWSLADMFAVRRRQWRNIEAQDNEINYKKYLEIYNSIVPKASFDNLPVPKNWYQKPSKARVMAPKYVSGDSFKAFHRSKEEEAQRKKEEMEAKKRQREQFKAAKEAAREAEKEKKKNEREAKKREREEKREEKKKSKKMRKRDETVRESSEEDSQQVVYMDGSEDEYAECLREMAQEVDENVCFECGSDRDLDGWIGCDMCERWYHRGCSGEQRERIQCMSEEDVSEFCFVCDQCKM